MEPIVSCRKETRAVKQIGSYILGAVITLCGICSIWMAIRLVGNRIACHKEVRLKTEDPSGYIFEVEDTTCDILAKDEAISVYARKVDPKGPWVLSGWRNQRTLLFRYDPGRWDNPLPSITHLSQSTILISVPEVSSIDYQNRKWANMSVNYEIGRVDYPAASKQQRP